MKSLRVTKLAVLAGVLLATIACTLPFTITPVEPEEKIIYIEITSTPEETTAEAETPTDPAATPPVAVNLDGIWTIWQGAGEQQLTINFLQQGYTIIGNAASGSGHSLLFKGTINQDSKGATGTWESTSGTSGVFSIYLADSMQTFSGNLGGGVAFCGTRSGNLKPSPCLK
jgi:hypothetical protein